jgi:ribonuclease J
MATLTFYGGVGEIGGNKILLEDKKRIFLDFGTNFEKERRYYEPPYLQPRKEEHLLGLGILPPLQGLYKNDQRAPDIDAVLLSHSHLDHYGYLKYMKNQIPVVCSESTKNMVVAKEVTSASSSPKKYRIADRTVNDGLCIYKDFRTFEGGNPLEDPVECTPMQVDHSVPDAHGFIVDTSDGAVVYTGDLRFHGPHKAKSEEFIAEAQKVEPEALIIEGTNLVDAKLSCEDEVKSKVTDVIEYTTGLSMACFSMNDIDRLETFYNASEKKGRKLVISMKLAYMIHNLQSDSHISVFSLKDSDVLIFRRDITRTHAWEKVIIDEYGGKIITAQQVEPMQSKLVLTCTFYDMNELLTVNPVPGSTYIMSQSEPFNEEMEINFEKLSNWLEWFGIPHYHIHCSGHALPHQLKEAISNIKPKKVFLVHTEKPELYKRYLSDLTKKEKIEIITPEEGKKYTL